MNDRYLYCQRLIGHFWKIWQAEYLPKLTVRQKWQNEVPPLQEGDVVLISEDNVKQSNWPLGMVAEVHEGVGCSYPRPSAWLPHCLIPLFCSVRPFVCSLSLIKSPFKKSHSSILR